VVFLYLIVKNRILTGFWNLSGLNRDFFELKLK